MNGRLPFITAMRAEVHQLELSVPAVPREGRDDMVGGGGEPGDIEMHIAVDVVEAALVARLEEHQARETEQQEARQDDAQKIDPGKPSVLRTTVDAPMISIAPINTKTESSTLMVTMTHAIVTTSPAKKTTQTLVVFIWCE